MTEIIRQGKLEVITGPMFSGKTSELIRRIRRYEHGGFGVQVFNPFVDNRYSAGYLNTHDAYSQIKTIPLSDDLRELKTFEGNQNQIFAFDEIQFFEDSILKYVFNLLKDGKTVLAAGLNLDFAGNPFRFKDSEKHIGELLAIADDVTYLTSVCKYRLSDGLCCPNPATRTQRIVLGDELVMVGGKDFYEARCPIHHFIEDE